MRIYLSLLLLSLMNLSYAQEEIFLENPSFEGLPRLSQTPKGWYDCGFPGESTVDLHPVPESQFRVDKMAIDGETYVGMITRENETWEAISQRLSQPLAGGKTYNFSIYLAQAAAYLSSLQNSPKDKINFNTPIKLRIWGGNGYCKKDELLAESLSVTNKEWLKFDFALRPDSDLRYIILEAFYQTSAPASYNGNILLDNASSILEVENAELSREDSLTTVRLRASARTPVFTADSSSKDKDVSENLATEDSAKAKSTVIKPSQKKLKEGVLKEEDRNFIKEQLQFVKFEDKSKYLEDKGIDAVIKIAQRLNTFEEDLKIAFYVNAVDKSWDKGRGKEVLNLFLEAGIPRNNIRLVRFSLNTKQVYFEDGGYSDIYLRIY